MKTLRVLVLVFLALTLIGFLDATYLTVEHYLGSVPPCLVTEGCSTVLNSKWSAILGIPVALFGAVYYLILVLLTLWHLKKNRPGFPRVAAWLTLLGFAASIWFIGVQLFAIKQFCFYCLISAAVSTALFVISIFALINPLRPPAQ